jgi:hypothetical protein
MVIVAGETTFPVGDVAIFTEVAPVLERTIF